MVKITKINKNNKGETMKKQYIFWQEVNKQVREECTIEASSLDEATQKHNDGYCDYIEVDALNENEIINEGVDELPLTKKELQYG